MEFIVQRTTHGSSVPRQNQCEPLSNTGRSLPHEHELLPLKLWQIMHGVEPSTQGVLALSEGEQTRMEASPFVHRPPSSAGGQVQPGKELVVSHAARAMTPRKRSTPHCTAAR